MNRIVECRYEHFVREGKVFTEWFKYTTVNDETLTEKDILKKCKEETKSIDKATKLKHEFRIA